MSLVLSSQVSADMRAEGKGERPPRPTFSEIDINTDGEIDFDEFSSHEVPHGDHQKIFTDIDADNDGIISEQEYIEHKPPPHQER